MIRTTTRSYALAASIATVCAAVEILAASPMHAQVGRPVAGDPAHEASAGSARVTAGPDYVKRGAIWRFFLGDNWREVWAAPIEAPVLDIKRYGGGLTAYKSGGNQTRTLHMKGGDGRHYVFRSVGKSVERSLGPDLQRTFVGGVIQDQNSANLPSAATVSDVVQRAVGVLHPAPRLYIMPDDPSLGEFRAEYGNMLGHIEIKPDDVPEGTEQFGHADKIQDVDKLMENLEASLEYRLDAHAYLKVRLVDAIMGDFDRGGDQWDFARYDTAGIKVYQPIARDRDWAYMRSNGALMRKVRSIYAKIGSYDPENERLKSITFMTHEFDRSHLVSLSWSEWEQVVREIMTSLPDPVIDAAVRAQPAPYAALSADRLRAGLMSRRDGLPELAREFYEMVNREADVFAADSDELADIERRPDGSLSVRLMRYNKDGELATKEGYAIDRVFLPAETDEVRVYMQDGNDRVIVRGSGPDDIKLRIIGGAGDDFIADSAALRGGGGAVVYDATGANTITGGPGTRVHTKPYVTAQPGNLDPEDKPKPRAVREERRGHFQDMWHAEGADFATSRTQNVSTRFWGANNSMMPVIDLRDGSGLILGAGMSRKSYGFRSEPFASRLGVRAMYATGAERFAAQLMGEWHPRNAGYALTADVLGSGIESQRFYGYGNNTPRIDDHLSLVLRDELRVQSAITWRRGEHTSASIGPVLRIVNARPLTGSPAAQADLLGTDTYSAAGAALQLEHRAVDHGGNPHRGYRGSFAASSFAGLRDGDGRYTRASGEVAVYIPLFRPTLALRAGGQKDFGDVPIYDAAMLGGRSTVRGFAWNRFTGDASVFGNAELRVPVTRAELLVRGDLGVILLADAGRVWLDGDSPGGWHHSFGGGISFASLSKAVSLVYARGEINRVYLNLGLPF